MSVTIKLDLPEEPLLSMKIEANDFARELPLLAAVKLYELGRLSSGRAAQLAGINRVEFLLALGRYHVSLLQLDADSLAEDIANA